MTITDPLNPTSRSRPQGTMRSALGFAVVALFVVDRYIGAAGPTPHVVPG